MPMTGHDVLGAIVGRQAFERLYTSLEKTDELSAELLRDVWSALADALDLTANQREALARLQGSVENVGRWQPDLQRNNIFKAANSLGLKLPSHLFASQKEAGMTATKKDLKLKNGDVVPKGTRAEVRYLGERDPHGRTLAHLVMEWVSPTTGRNYRFDPMRVSITRLWEMVGGVAKPPGLARLEKMSDDAVATTPSGKRVEPDAWGSDGSPSWMLVMGVL